MGRKRYSETYKQSTVDKVMADATVVEVSRETGVSQTSIHKWVLAYERGHLTLAYDRLIEMSLR